MDFSNVVRNNKFLKSLFKNEFPEKVTLVKLNLGYANESGFCLKIKKEPNVEIKKWGKWGRDYNALILYFYGEIINATIERFDIHRDCTLHASTQEGVHSIIFEGEGVCAKITFKYIFYEKGRPVFYDEH